MVQKIIILGELNKKHLLPLFLVIYQISYQIFIKYYPEKVTNIIIDMYTMSLGMMSIIFLPCVFKLNVKEEQREKEIHKRKWLHYLILIVIYIIYNMVQVTVIIMKSESSVKEKSRANQIKNPFAEGPFSYIGLEMVFLTVISIILLKYKYFIHHYISLATFVLFGNFNDFILGNYQKIINYGAIMNIIQILGIIIDVIYYYYQKYMMEKFFYSYWSISFTLGVTLIFITTGYLIYVLVKKEEADIGIINGKEFYSYFKSEDVGLKIGKQILNYIFSTISTILYILNIYHFNPNYILISFQFSKLVDVLTSEGDASKYYCIIFFVFQLFFLMIYLEILELNFCNLNENTKKNVEFRSILESAGENGRDSSIGIGAIDINRDYSIYSDNCDKIDKDIELLQQNENEVNDI